MQPLTDGFKLLVKEVIIPSSSNQTLFLMAPIITFFISLVGWGVIPFTKHGVLAETNIGLLYIIAISSLGVYGIIISGWSSNSKYAFLGALRSAAQMVSYEISLGFVLVTLVLNCGSFNLQDIIINQTQVWYIIPFFPLFLIFFISGLAETNRHPFDLPEAEAELVSGYNVEYSAMGFALFSLGEYSNMLLMSSLCIILFLGGWQPAYVLSSLCNIDFWFGLKICMFVILFVWMRAALPRYRYDQLMNLGWKTFLPISLTYLFFSSTMVITFDLLPF